MRPEVHQAQSQIHPVPAGLFLQRRSPDSNGELSALLICHFIRNSLDTVPIVSVVYWQLPISRKQKAQGLRVGCR